jgi:hypothetical protein
MMCSTSQASSNLGARLVGLESVRAGANCSLQHVGSVTATGSGNIGTKDFSVLRSGRKEAPKKPFSFKTLEILS